MNAVYIVGTPIGNLKDITLRALETLRAADWIACEDTRVTKVLLDAYEIKKPLTAYHKFNEAEAAERIYALYSEGKTVAVVTDAGMPGISDPGAVLVRYLRKKGVKVESVPGATAVATAVAIAGLERPGFAFVGFLPEKKKDCDKLLLSLKDCPLPLVFYVPPHDLKSVYGKLLTAYGDRPITVVKELTKIFETVGKGTLAAPPEMVEKGEFVLIVEAGKKKNDISPEARLAELIAEGFEKKAAVKAVAEEYGLPKNEVYRFVFND